MGRAALLVLLALFSGAVHTYAGRVAFHREHSAKLIPAEDLILEAPDSPDMTDLGRVSELEGGDAMANASTASMLQLSGIKIANGRFELDRKLGEGSFGEVWRGFDLKNGGKAVAIKLEKLSARSPLLEEESRMYRRLQDVPGIPAYHWFGTEGDYRVLVMELLGKSLEDLMQCCRKFSLKTVLMLVDQMLARIEAVHNKGIVHRDIKPDNFMMDAEKDRMLHIIDFGLATPFQDRSGRHLAYREGQHFAGTARYSSINALRGSKQSRRDDLEAIAYLLIYLHKGKLPWMGIKARNTKEKTDAIAAKKESTSPEDLAKHMPREFADFLKYAKNLGFEDVPEYSKWRRTFKDLFFREGYSYDLVWDWKILNC